MAAALGAALLTIPGPGHAQTITNTARAAWVQGGEARSADSNTVQTAVEPNSVTIDLLHPAMGAAPLSLAATICQGAPIQLVPPTNAGSRFAAAAAAVPAAITIPAAQTSSVRIGELLLLRVNAPLANRDSNAIESLVVTVAGSSGDREQLTIFETSVNSGVFVGAIRTASIPPTPVSGDCRLSVRASDTIQATLSADEPGRTLASRVVDVLADPFGLVFDSVDGAPVSGARVTIVDAASGQPAQVFADDGVTPWPASVVTGQAVTDGAGTVYPMAAGEYRFPLMAFGTYALRVEPPSPYAAPSTATPAALAALVRPDGGAFQIVDASFGAAFALVTPDAVRIDIPVDRPNVGVTLTKTASRVRVQPGDPIYYTLTVTNPDSGHAQRSTQIVDLPSPWLRLRRDTLRIDGMAASQALSVSPDGRRIVIEPGVIPAGGTVRITYAMTLRGDTPRGQVSNRAEATDNVGNRAVAEATVMVDRDSIASKMTVIGRVATGPCTRGEEGYGIPGVRVMLEDGSFALTDRDGRYHFEGVEPGTHVIAIAPATLPEGAQPIDCEGSTRSAGSAISRFVIGQGGSLAVADFRAIIPGFVPPAAQTARGPDGNPLPVQPNAAAPANLLAEAARQVTSDRAASGADTDWLLLGDGPTDFLFPTAAYNPRIPSIRAVIRHKPGQTIALKINNQTVDPLAFEGARAAPGNAWSVSVWRGIPLSGPKNVLTATVTNPDGTVAAELERVVQFVSAPWRAEIVAAKSKLVADGKTRPVAAVRFTDREGRPVRSGVTGAFAVGEPYQSAAMLDQLQLGQLTGQGSAGATWTIEDDEGIALIELAPTMVSGPLHLDFNFIDEELTRRQQLESWIVPGELPFTLVGLAEASIGTKSVADQMERGGSFDSDLGEDARVAFYAKGRVLGKVLLTVAYDSAKEKAGQRLLGAIDPSAYYTIYADGSTRRFDAASTEKLYVRLEAGAFYALYGDFVTGFDQTLLARYQRTMTGVKAETRLGALHAQAFAAEVASRHRRDEIQGQGISGPYALANRNILANSERVAIEVRDRLRSEIVVSRRELSRFIDYDIDILAGTITFREPVLSRDFDLNPQFIVVDYEAADGIGEARWNAGARADVTFAGKANEIRLGATAISDRGDGDRTSLAAIDLRARIGAATEIRAETALSRREGQDSTGWLVEAEHHTGKLDVLAYARQTDRDFGTGQQNGVELGRRKFGVDGRYALNENASFVARSWYDESTTDASSRFAVQGDFVYRGLSGEGRIGIAHLTDHLADGRSATSTVLEASASKRLMGNRLELGVGTSIALGETGSIDLPTRHRFRARYVLNDAVRLVGNYEIAHGDKIDARDYNLGFELSPWAGSRMVTTIGRQDIAEAGSRSYAAFGLAQSVNLTQRLTLDATVDGNRKLGGATIADLVNPLHPAASGGQLTDGAQFEDFTALTLGLAWRVENWSATVRGEWRDGEFADRKGLTGGVIRQLGDGVTLGGGASWTRASGLNSASTEVIQAALAAAYRPADSDFSALGKLEYRGDKVTDAVLGQLAPVGRTALTVDGDARSERLVASLSTNWRPESEADGKQARRTEIGLFLGARYNFDRLEQQNLTSSALLGGLDARIGLGERVEVGGSATVRANMSDGTTAFAVGPQVGISPAKNTLLILGYNIKGFRDADFAAARHTDEGIYASVRVKLDSDTFSFLGLGR